MDNILIIAPTIGIFVGLLMGLTGAGGGILSVPLLFFGLGLEVTQAVPIALFSVAISAAVGVLFDLKLKTLRYRAAILVGVFGAIFAPLGLWVSHKIPNAPLTIIFSIVLIVVSIRMFIRARGKYDCGRMQSWETPPCLLDESIGKLVWTTPCAKALIFSGIIAGFLSGLLGVGGGFVVTPALNKFTDLPMRSIVATSLAVLAIVSTVGALFAITAGVMQWNIALPFIVGSTVGLMIGRLLIAKMDGGHVQQIFAIASFCLALSLIYKVIN